MKTSPNSNSRPSDFVDGVQYWLDLVGYLSNAGMAVCPLSLVGGLDQEHRRLLAEVLIPFHAPDGKKYGFTVYILNKPNFAPAFEEMHALLEMAPKIAKEFGHLCEEVYI
jgi:hypothetical protein